MSIRHRVKIALGKHDPATTYKHKTFEANNTVHFVFEQAGSAELVSEMLRIIFKRKSLIHKGRKP